MITVDDFVMLGKTVPEPSSDGRIFVCSAGVSPQMTGYRRSITTDGQWRMGPGSLVRIYPLARRAAPPRWTRCTVPLERNPKDHRQESWQLATDRSPGAHETANRAVTVGPRVPDREWSSLLAPYRVDSIAEANELGLSLAILQPDIRDLEFDDNPDAPDAPQLKLFDLPGVQPTAGAKRFALMPRLIVRDGGNMHRLMLRDWGCFELMRKQGYAYARQNMTDALHLRPDSSLLVGNLNNIRNRWIAISVLNHLRTEPDLFSALPSERRPIPPSVRAKVLARDGRRCVRCAATDDLTIDHKVPYIRGGTNEADNLQTLCRSCNSSKGDRLDGAA